VKPPKLAPLNLKLQNNRDNTTTTSESFVNPQKYLDFKPKLVLN
jgi:hypothetical protein